MQFVMFSIYRLLLPLELLVQRVMIIRSTWYIFSNDITVEWLTCSVQFTFFSKALLLQQQRDFVIISVIKYIMFHIIIMCEYYIVCLILYTLLKWGSILYDLASYNLQNMLNYVITVIVDYTFILYFLCSFCPIYCISWQSMLLSRYAILHFHGSRYKLIFCVTYRQFSYLAAIYIPQLIQPLSTL